MKVRVISMLKKVFKEEISKEKNFNEIMHKVEKKEERKRELKYILIPAVLVAIVAISTLALVGYRKSNIPSNSIAENNTQDKIKIANVELTSDISQDIGGVGRKISDTDKEYAFMQQIELPKDMKLSYNWKLYWPEDWGSEEYTNGNKELKEEDWAQTEINYCSENNINDYKSEKYEENRTVEICFSKYDRIARCTPVVGFDEIESSYINNTELKLLNYNTTYLARFNYNNLTFEIICRNLAEDEFITLIESIIK